MKDLAVPGTRAVALQKADCMSAAPQVCPGELRAMMKLAGQLRASAADSCDEICANLFLRGAIALEERAARFALRPLRALN